MPCYLPSAPSCLCATWQVLEAREAQMKAEIRIEEVMTRLQQSDSKAHELQLKSEEYVTNRPWPRGMPSSPTARGHTWHALLTPRAPSVPRGRYRRKADEAHAEVSELESEKYQLGDDIETLEGELEEANEQIKRYYELVAERDAALAKRKADVDELERKVVRLEYDKELIELRSNPVEEGGDDVNEIYAQVRDLATSPQAPALL